MLHNNNLICFFIVFFLCTSRWLECWFRRRWIESYGERHLKGLQWPTWCMGYKRNTQIWINIKAEVKRDRERERGIQLERKRESQGERWRHTAWNRQAALTHKTDILQKEEWVVKQPATRMGNWQAVKEQTMLNKTLEKKDTSNLSPSDGWYTVCEVSLSKLAVC